MPEGVNKNGMLYFKYLNYLPITTLDVKNIQVLFLNGFFVIDMND